MISGEYSCLTVDLTFKREFSYYLLTIYIPCCMLVIVSWVSFWLDPNAVPARVSLGVTTLLTMSTQTASINNSLPPVAYTKAIDVWTGVRSIKTSTMLFLSVSLTKKWFEECSFITSYLIHLFLAFIDGGTTIYLNID